MKHFDIINVEIQPKDTASDKYRSSMQLQIFNILGFGQRYKSDTKF